MPTKYEEMIRSVAKATSEETARVHAVGAFLGNLPDQLVTHLGAPDTLKSRFEFRHPDRPGETADAHDAIRRDKHRTYSTLVAFNLTIDRQSVAFSFRTTIRVLETGKFQVSFMEGHATEVNPQNMAGAESLADLLAFAVSLRLAADY